MIIFEEGEQILKVLRRHYFVILPLISAILLLSLAPLAVYEFLLSGFLPFDESIINTLSDFALHYKVFAYSLWLLLLWMFFFIEWTDYYLDFWVITNKHILDVEQRGFFHREVISFRYEQIQDITVETKGFLETMLKFGTLHIQTAGESKQIIIRDAHEPEVARALILKLQEQSKAK